MSRRLQHVTILGAGPVGLIAALKFAQTGRAVTLIAEHFPRAGQQVRIDAVPAAFVALLLDFGVSPRSIGADHVEDRRRIAWNSARLHAKPVPKTVYLERPALELALFETLQRSRAVRIEQRKFSRRRVLAHDHAPDEYLIDATGRSAATATRRVRPPKPWVARTFWAPHSRRGSIVHVCNCVASGWICLPGIFDIVCDDRCCGAGASRHRIRGRNSRILACLRGRTVGRRPCPSGYVCQSRQGCVGSVGRGEFAPADW